jgi:hypothetical protein
LWISWPVSSAVAAVVAVGVCLLRVVAMSDSRRQVVNRRITSGFVSLQITSGSPICGDGIPTINARLWLLRSYIHLRRVPQPICIPLLSIGVTIWQIINKEIDKLGKEGQEIRL